MWLKFGKKGYDFSRSLEPEGIKKRRFNFSRGHGPLTSEAMTVDATLAVLFECLTVECSGILVHPQWKHFRHIKIVKNDQIRLSNGIWRSWYLQFQRGRKPLFCQFDIDTRLDHHRGDEAVVLEGKYWKRKKDAVAAEYRKWRAYYREKNKKNRKRDPFIAKLLETALGDELGDGPKSVPQAMQVDPSRTFWQPLYDGYPSELMGTSTASPGATFARGSADVIQPNLDMLNPTLDELLDKLDPMDVILSRSVNSISGLASFNPSPFFGGTSAYQPLISTATPSTSALPLSMSSLRSQQQPSQQQQSTHFSQTLDTSSQVPGEQFNGLISQVSVTQKPIPPLMPISQPFGTAQAGFNPSPSSLGEQFVPSSLLTMPPGQQDKSRESPIEASMEIGTPQISNFAMKPEPSGDETSSMQTCSHDQQLFNSSVGVYQSQDTPTTTPTPPPLHQEYGAGIGASVNGSTISSSQDSIFNPMSTTTPADMGIDSKQPPEPVMTSLLNQFFASENQPSALHSPSPPIRGTPLSHVTPTSAGPLTPHGTGIFEFPPSISQQQTFETQNLSQASSGSSPSLQARMDMPPPSHYPVLRVSSAGNLGAISDTVRPPLERGKSEPTRYLDQQVQKLSELTELGERQMKEIEKQQGLAQLQYAELLQQYLRQTSGKTSEQQQQVLQSVLADPSLISILRNVLLQAPPTTLPSGSSPLSTAAVSLIQGAQDHAGERGIALATPTKTEAEESASSSLSLSHLVSPTQLAKATGVSDFQSRLVVAAAAQASSSNLSPLTPFSTSPSTPAGPSLGRPLLAATAMEAESNSQSLAVSQKLKNVRSLNPEEKEVYKELRRQSHISAEQKRRGNIKHGFDHLQSLVINISAYPSGKVSKATVLEKTIDHIRHCHQERDSRDRQIEALKREIEELNSSISRCQEQLPASGAPVTRQRFEENRQRFKEYIQKRTLQNYKFWIFSIILRQLFESYNSMVSTGSTEELCRTVLAWFEQNCTLPALRPVVRTSLRELSMKTSILSNPSQVPHQLVQYAKQELQQQQHERSQEFRHMS